MAGLVSLFLLLLVSIPYFSLACYDDCCEPSCPSPPSHPKYPPRHPPKTKPPHHPPKPPTPPCPPPSPTPGPPTPPYSPPTPSPTPVPPTPPYSPPAPSPTPVPPTPPTPTPTPRPPYSPPTPTPTPRPPAPGPAYCPIDALKLNACIDVLSGLIHIVIGQKAKAKCCPLVQGIADLDAALCLCTIIRARLLNINIYLPIALELLITCGKHPPPGFQCPPLH